VAISVAGVIEPALQAAEIARSAARSTSDLTTYDLYLRALSHFMIYEKERILQALDWLGQALDRDPRYGPALGLAANFRLHLDGFEWADDVEANRRIAVDLARQALHVTVDEPNILARAGFVLAYFGDDVAACGSLIERALELNPSSAYARLCGGWIRLWSGQPAAAIEHFNTYFRLNPRGPRGPPLTGIGFAHLFEQRHEEAVGAFRASLQLLPSYSWAYCGLAACYAHMGQLDDARATVERLRAITPLVTRIATLFRKPEDRELFLSGLRLAAGATT